MQVLVQDKEKTNLVSEEITALKLKLQSVETELHLLQEKRKAQSCTWKSHIEDMQVVMKKMKTSAHQLNL